MVHDELAAAEHRLIIEVGTLLRAGLERSAAQTADVLAGWAGLVPSPLLDVTRTVLQRPDPPGWREFGDVLELPVGGDGLPGVRNALDLAVPVTVAAEAVAARTRHWTSTTVPVEPAALLALTADDIRTGWYAARVVAYAQGFQQLRAAGWAYGWGMDAAAVAGA